MEEFRVKLVSAKNALKTLQQVMEESETAITRDAAIKRFEYTFEIAWKAARECLKEKHGIVVNSPKSTYKELFVQKYVSEEQSVDLMKMTDDRNLTSHTYQEALAISIYKKLPGYADGLANLISAIS